MMISCKHIFVASLLLASASFNTYGMWNPKDVTGKRLQIDLTDPKNPVVGSLLPGGKEVSYNAKNDWWRVGINIATPAQTNAIRSYLESCGIVNPFDMVKRAKAFNCETCVICMGNISNQSPYKLPENFQLGPNVPTVIETNCGEQCGCNHGHFFHRNCILKCTACPECRNPNAIPVLMKKYDIGQAAPIKERLYSAIQMSDNDSRFNQTKNVIEEAKVFLPAENFADFFLSSIYTGNIETDPTESCYHNTTLAHARDYNLELYLLNTAEWAVQTNRISGEQLTKFICSIANQGNSFLQNRIGRQGEPTEKLLKLIKLAIESGWYTDQKLYFALESTSLCSLLSIAICNENQTTANSIINLALLALEKKCLTQKHVLDILTSRKVGNLSRGAENVIEMARLYHCDNVADQLETLTQQ